LILEICIDSIESAIAAKEGGADRLEVCSSLAAGGTTPSVGLVQQCIRLTGLPVMMMIRPHDGGFVYSQQDIELMVSDIESAKSLGVTGVVFGCLDASGCVDVEAGRRLCESADGLETTFHRAFDVGGDPIELLDQLIELGFDRVLTSGQAASAEAGSDVIAQLVQHSAGRIEILAGAGVWPDNVQTIAATGVTEVHASASVEHPQVADLDSLKPVQFGHSRRVTSATMVRAIMDAIAIS